MDGTSLLAGSCDRFALLRDPHQGCPQIPHPCRPLWYHGTTTQACVTARLRPSLADRWTWPLGGWCSKAGRSTAATPTR